MRVAVSGYKIKEQLYESSQSLVYRGYSKKGDKPVILKILKKEYPSLAELTRFRREYEIIRKIQLADIIQAHELKNYKNSLVMVLEDFGGDSLAQVLSFSQIELTELLPLAIRITEILGQIHQQHWIHKDINPSNIIWNRKTDQLKIIDFGIATELPIETPQLLNPRVLEGTLAYMSPEQTGRMNRPIDLRTDLYSLGVTLYAMFTGQLPFQAADSMELVHCHIAKPPPSARKANPKIPKILSDILKKLMAKTAEDRYQSAFGVKVDLQSCLHQIQQKTSETFEIAQQDYSDKFQFSQKLYGRREEIDILFSAFDQVSRGTFVTLIVTGHAGTGKTALVHEIHKHIIQKHSYFISGSFDPLNRNIPYSAIIQAFRTAIHQIITQSEELITRWREKLTKAVGTNGQIIIDVIPELKHIIGKQPPVPHLSPAESQKRFNALFHSIIQAIGSAKHPFILFFDNLQWADSPSLQLIEQLMKNPIPYLLLIGAYRSEESNPPDRVTKMVETAQQAQIITHHINLEPLSLKQVNRLIADTLQCELQHSQPLARLCRKKTGGNPFFLNQFIEMLYQERLIAFDYKQLAWQWDIQKIQKQNITDNVVQLLTEKLEKLSDSCRDILKLASCIGQQFDLNTLAVVNDAPASQISEILWEALQQGLIMPIGDKYQFMEIEDPNSTNHTLGIKAEMLDAQSEIPEYKFLHERVQYATYSLIPEADRHSIHLKIGRLLLKNTAPDQLEDNIYTITDHINIGSELIAHQEEKVQCAEFNLQASRKAKESTAYETALQYLKKGILLLGEEGWKTHYRLSFSLHLERSECEYLNGNFEVSEESFGILFQRVQADTDKAKIYTTKMALYRSLGKHYHVIQLAREGLALFKVHLPMGDNEIRKAIDQEFKAMQTDLRDQEIQKLIHLPDMQDQDRKSMMGILMNLISSAYFISPYLLYPWVGFTMLNTSLKYGNTDSSAYGYSICGVILGNLGDYELGHEFGKLGIQVSEKYDAFKCRSYMVMALLINSWREHIRTDIDYSNQAYQYAMNTGEFYYAAWSLCIITRTRILRGDPLETIHQEVQKHIPFLEQTIHELAPFLIVTQQMGLCLRGKTHDSKSFSDGHVQETQVLQRMQINQMKPPLNWYHILKTQILYLFEYYEEALLMSEEAEKTIDTASGMVQITEHYFYTSLTLIALYPKADHLKKKMYWKKLETYQKQMKAWAGHCSANFLHKYWLIDAEMQNISGNTLDAMRLYQQGIISANENGYFQNEAIGNELAAKFYLKIGYPEIAKTYMTSAYQGYLQWGAEAKVKNLLEKYPGLLSQLFSEQSTNFNHLQSISTTSGDPSGMLDLNTVIKATQAFSGEIVLATLLRQIMHIVIENAGAQKGVLLLEKNGHWLIEAEKTMDSDHTTVLQSLPIDEDLAHMLPVVPVSVIYYVIRTQKTLVLKNASKQREFAQDPYLQHHQILSALCIPLIKQGQLIGIFYLENNLVSDVFSKERLDLLKVLSFQMAIAIENARLYQSLGKREEQYRTLIESINVGIYRISAKGYFLQANTAMLKIFHYNSFAELKEVPVTNLYNSSEQRQKLLDKLQKDGYCKHYELQLKQKEGTPIWVELSVEVQYDQEGRIKWYNGAVEDITERKEAEAKIKKLNEELEQRVKERTSELQQSLESLQKAQQQLIVQEKLASLGNMTAGISHELKNPLNLVNNFAEQCVVLATDLENELSQEDQNKEEIQQILNMIKTASMGVNKHGKRADSIIQTMLFHSRSEDTEWRPTLLNNLLQEYTDLAFHSMRALDSTFNVTLKSDFDQSIGNVNVVPQNISRAFLNILNNALYAVREKCQNNTTDFLPLVKVKTENKEDQIEIRIWDNGNGIPQENVDKIFEPFFTTKPTGSGTGLGLSLSYDIIVQEHQGSLRVRSEEGEHTEFVITIPHEQ